MGKNWFAGVRTVLPQMTPLCVSRGRGRLYPVKSVAAAGRSVLAPSLVSVGPGVRLQIRAGGAFISL